MNRMHFKKANCGHFMRDIHVVTDYYGYTYCIHCQDDNDITDIRYRNRVSARLGKDGVKVQTLTGLPLGVVVERVKNNGARTPTNGKYSSDRMTVNVPGDGTWYANGPKDGTGNVIVLRRP